MVGDEPVATLVVPGQRLRVGDIAVRKRHPPVTVLSVVAELSDSWIHPAGCQVLRVRPSRPWEMLRAMVEGRHPIPI
jgi:hypothetical protein